MRALNTKILFSVFLLGLDFLFNVGFSAENAHANSVKVQLINPKGEVIGSAVITEMAKGVQIDLEARQLTPGKHGIHFHENGACVAPDFKSAGEHFAHNSARHGFNNPTGPHEGDLTNLVADAHGNTKARLTASRVTLREGPTSLLKAGGSSLVLHAKADDYRSQPAGGTGDRIACGEINGR